MKKQYRFYDECNGEKCRWFESEVISHAIELESWGYPYSEESIDINTLDDAIEVLELYNYHLEEVKLVNTN